MSQANLSIRMDDKLKRDFDRICGELGLTMSTAITMFAKKMTHENRIPFEVSLDPFYCYENINALEKSIDQMKNGRTVTKTLEELEQIFHE